MTLQQTLDGTTIKPENDPGIDRDRPTTFLYCPRCAGWILRSDRHDHPHDTETLRDPDEYFDAEAAKEDPDVVGAYYDVTLEYNFTFRFRVPAWNDSFAKERARELVEYGNAADAHEMWANTREGDEILETDDAAAELEGGY